MATFLENFRNNANFSNIVDKNKKILDESSKMNALDRSIFIKNQQKSGSLQPIDNVNNVVSTTFAIDDDGISYGVGSDGNTYAYVLVNNKVEELKPLSADEQRRAISKITGGRINVDPIITNKKSLNDIFRSVSRMYGNGGFLTPNEVDILDMYPGAMRVLDAVQGTAHHDPQSYDADKVKINGLDFPDIRRMNEKISNNAGWWTDRENKALGEGVITHELSHTAENAANDLLTSFTNKKEEEAGRSKNKYPASELFKKTFLNLFGKDYEPQNAGQDILDELGGKIQQWDDEDYDKYGTYSISPYTILKIAAKNTGFDSINDAAASISGYAGEIYKKDPYTVDGEVWFQPEDSVRPEEVFAEAYTDVLINGNKAVPFSKEIIKLYSEYTDKMAERTGEAAKKRVNEMQRMLGALPDFQANKDKPRLKTFHQNFIDFSKK